MDITMYEAQADTINVDDICTYSNNRIVMRRIERDDANEDVISLYILGENYEDEEDCVDYFNYVPEGAGDMGWLGYFVGKNDHLEVLNICPFEPPSGASVRDVLEPFFRGISCNKSILTLSFSCMDLLGGEMFTMLTPFFKNNYNLTTIIINECDFGDEWGRLFALALGSSTHKSLQKVELENNNIGDGELVDIITSLSMHPHLKSLDLDGNRLRKNGCVALATLLQCSAKELQYLFVSRNEIDDDGIETLVPALANCSGQIGLNICNNPSITTKGWQSLATILEAPNSNLEELGVRRNSIDDQAAATFANALTNNNKLRTIYMDSNPSITAKGWQAFTKVLCDTSSINATFLSNHTLRYMGNEIDRNEIIGPLLRLNRRLDKKEVAIIKILQNHADFNMQPFFEWEFKVLPLVISWLERASGYDMPEDFEPNIEPRKLSTIYQFVRGMPVLYVETRLRKELEDIKSQESQLEEEQLNLQQESEERKQYLQEQKKLLEERKKSIMKRIAKPKFN